MVEAIKREPEYGYGMDSNVEYYSNAGEIKISIINIRSKMSTECPNESKRSPKILLKLLPSLALIIR
jgi:hypothetical protein